MKKWYESKTLWINFIALIAIVLQGITGKEILSTETQGIVLTVVNMVMRLVTKHGLFEEGNEAE
jgi:hypothetical protein